MPAITGISSNEWNRRMTRIANCSIILLLLALIAPFPAWAQQRGLFLIKNPLQYVDLTYEYRNSSTGGSGINSTTTQERHDLRPRYFIRFDYAIYDPDILQGSFAGSAKYDYSHYSSSPGLSGSKNGPGYELDVNGVFFNRKPLSADFTVRSRDDLVMPEYSPSYDIYTDYYKAGLRYKNPVIPLSAYYYNVTARTSGQTNDSKMTNETVTFDANHNYRQVSVSKFSFIYNDMTNTYERMAYDTHHTYYLFTLDNTFAPTLGRFRPSFGTNLSYQKDSGDYAGTTYQARENISCFLGRALETGANYSYYRIERDINTQSQTTNNAELWLEHQLYSSLRTRLAFRGNFDRYQDGYVDTTSASLMTTYTKNLPDMGRLYFRIGDTYEVKNQDFSNTTQTRIDQPVTFESNFTDVVLGNNVLSVTRAIDIVDGTPYYENVDFVLIPGPISYLSVIPGSTLFNRTFPRTLKITYTYQVNPAIKYGTNILNISSNVSLYQDRYYLYVNYEQRNQNLWSGQDNVVVLGPSSFLRAGAELRLNNNLNTFGIEYQNLEYIYDSRESIAGYWRYTGRIGSLALNTTIQDTYIWYRSNQVTSTRSTYSDNALSAMVNMTQRLFRNSVLQLTTNYVMIRGDSPSRDDLIFRLRYLWAMGKFRLAVDVQSFLRFMNGENQINNLVRFEVRRYFW